MKTVFCLMGESGSGKTEIARELEFYGYKIIQSYTTRPQRKIDEWGHTFCSNDDYENFNRNGEIVAYSLFNNYHYFSTKEQMYNCDIYVVDPDGIDDLKKKIDDIRFITIYLNVDEETRVKRMGKRGDNEQLISQRLTVDAEKFKVKQYEYSLINNDLTKCIDIIRYIIDAETNEIFKEN